MLRSRALGATLSVELFVVLGLGAIAPSLPSSAQARGPWPTRRRPGLRPNDILTERVPTTAWPREPETPRTLDAARFADALHQMCGWMPPERPARWGEWITRYAGDFQVDPFLVAALVYRQSRCHPDAEALDGPGMGLTQIHREMYLSDFESGVLRFMVRGGGAGLEQRSLRMDRFPFGGPRLLMAEPNIYFAAALLSMWRDQHETVDHHFDQREHRHYVSHFVWGDRVRSDWEEERILTDRRRMLEYYGAHRGPSTLTYHGVELGCPLDGCPRVVLSWLGAERDGGERAHRGVDVDSLPGEPVHAVADGFVYFAGVDLPGQMAHVQIARGGDYSQYPRDSLGAGGRYTCIRHAVSEGESSLRSCYMHLETVEVAYGDHVTRGQLLGTVGRTGMRSSAAHLHLEMHTDHLEDPSVIMRGLLIGEQPADPRARR